MGPTPLDVAARMLARAPRTEAELEGRLVARGYQRATAAATVARCRELGYVGDEAYAGERARSLRGRGWGSLRIAADLEARGLPEALVSAAVDASRNDEPEIETTVWRSTRLSSTQRFSAPLPRVTIRSRRRNWTRSSG